MQLKQFLFVACISSGLMMSTGAVAQNPLCASAPVKTLDLPTNSFYDVYLNVSDSGEANFYAPDTAGTSEKSEEEKERENKKHQQEFLSRMGLPPNIDSKDYHAPYEDGHKIVVERLSNGVVQVRDIASKKIIASLTIDPGLKLASISPNRKYLAAEASGATLIFDTTTGARVYTWPNYGLVHFATNSDTIVAIGLEKIEVIDLRKSKIIAIYDFRSDRRLNQYQSPSWYNLHANDKFMFSPVSSGLFKLFWDFSKPEPIFYDFFDVTDDVNYAITMTKSKDVMLFDTRADSILCELPLASQELVGIKISPSARYLFIQTRTKQLLYQIDINALVKNAAARLAAQARQREAEAAQKAQQHAAQVAAMKKQSAALSKEQQAEAAQLYSSVVSLMKEKEIEAAQLQLSALLRLDPANAKAHFLKGEIMASQNRPDDAKESWLFTIDFAPTSSEAAKARVRLAK